jgi:hypothetical protein
VPPHRHLWTAGPPPVRNDTGLIRECCTNNQGSTLATYAARDVGAWLVVAPMLVAWYGISIRRHEELRNDHMFHAGSVEQACHLHGQQKRLHH